MAEERTRPGNTPVEQQERSADEVESTRRTRLTVSGPGAADFIAAPGGLDTPEAGGKGMAQLNDDGPLSDARRLAPRLGPDPEAFPGERQPDDQLTGSQTGTIGGGGQEAHNPSAIRATGTDDDATADNETQK